MKFHSDGRRRLVAVLSLAAAATVGLTACSSSDPASPTGSAPVGGSSSPAGTTTGSKLSLVAFSVPKPAYDSLTTAFAATDKGKGSSFEASYGASGDQSRAVANGQKADIVAFSLEPDMTKLVPKFVKDGWNAGPTKGIVSTSVVVFAVRTGNPKNIKTWDDLVKPGVKVVTPDPGSSGSAKWNILAAYAQKLQTGGTEDDAKTYLKALFKNVVSKPESGSKATQTFLNGTGDVLLSYENEAISARQKGSKLDYVIPNETLKIENPAAVTVSAPQQATDFLDYAESTDGQKIFASKGFRPIDDGVSVGTVEGANDPASPFPAIGKLETIADLGGWTEANKKYFDKTDGIVTKIIAG